MPPRLARPMQVSLVVAAVAFATLWVADSASAQRPPQRPTQRPAQRPAQKASWKSNWSLQLASIYDDNAFRLSTQQQRTLASGSAQFANMNQPQDVINALGLEARFRRSGAGTKRLELGLGVQADVYTFSRQHTAVEFTTSIAQDLSTRDRISVEASYIPSELRRNYLIGTDQTGSFLYEAGVASTLGGKLQYDRQLLRGKGSASTLDFDMAVLGGRREYKDFSWRNRLELGGRVRTDLESGPLGLDLRALRLRAMHSGDPEPVATLASVSFLSLQRDFDETELGSEISLRTGKRTRMAFIYEWRLRDYVATLIDDPVYGDRRDTRNTVGGELRFSIRRAALVAGGSFERQTSFRPGSGDTDAEEDYERFRTFLRLDYGK
jgi:hypothetical protein